MRPVSIPLSIQKYINNRANHDEMAFQASLAYQNIVDDLPDVSIVIPAYNEAENIVPTLASLCNNKTNRKVEIIVVNNNSTDSTADLVNKCGVNCILETKQGITFARNAGLAFAKGKYVLNADADTIYPEAWIEEMTKPLDDDNIAVTYGRFSFIPIGKTGRTIYFFYEYLADLSRWINKYKKDEAVNVYGFNSGFRRQQGLMVDSFNHPEGTNEDGWMALKLRNKGFGKLYCVTSDKAIVWTTDRRIQIDGGLIKGFAMRFKRIFVKH